MRTPAASLSCCLALCLALCALLGQTAGTARAGEEGKPPPPPAGEDDSQARAERDRIAAGVIGRALVSQDPEVREQAIDRLLARLRQGGEVEPFLRAMGAVIGEWANEQDRLMEVWLDQAVNGTAEERDKAVLLLTALGTKAVRRLTLELRHSRRHDSDSDHGGVPLSAPKPAAAQRDVSRAAGAKSGPVVAGAELPSVQAELAAGEPRRYEVGDFIARGWGHFDLKTMMLKQADAVSAKRFTNFYVVTAPTAGHENLRLHLARLRAKALAAAPQTVGGTAPSAAAGATWDKKPDGAKKVGLEGDPAPPTGQAAPTPDSPATSKAASSKAASSKAAAPQGPVPLNRAAPAWRIAPELLYLPRGGWLAARLSAEDGVLRNRNPIRRSKTAVIVGSRADAQRWARHARKLPDARGELPLQGARELAPGGTARLFAGKEIRYSKDVARTKGGAWRIVTSTVPHGIELQIRVTKEAAGLRVALRAERSDVGLPLPVVTVEPSPQAAPVELEQPQWTTTRTSRSFLLPAEGGGAFLPLEGLGRSDGDQVVLVLIVEPYQPAPQQAVLKK